MPCTCMPVGTQYVRLFVHHMVVGKEVISTICLFVHYTHLWSNMAEKSCVLYVRLYITYLCTNTSCTCISVGMQYVCLFVHHILVGQHGREVLGDVNVQNCLEMLVLVILHQSTYRHL